MQKSHNDTTQSGSPQTVASLQLVPLGGASKVSLAGAVSTSGRICFQAQERGDIDAVELGPTATVIEGPLQSVLETIEKVALAGLHSHPRILLSLNLDVAPGQEHRLSKKKRTVSEVQQHIKHS